jgi:hypothetical protein
MSLDLLLEPIPVRDNQPCKVGRYLVALEDPYKTALLNLLNIPVADGGMSSEHVAQRMSQAGLPVGSTAVRRHREKRCPCESVVVA